MGLSEHLPSRRYACKERVKNVPSFKKASRAVIVAAVALAAVLSVGFLLNRVADGGILDLIMPMSMDNVVNEPHFAGIVVREHGKSILASIDEGEDAHRVSDLVSVSLDAKLKDSVTHLTVGDRIIVYYNGEIAATYPAQIDAVYAIVLASPAVRISMDDLDALSAMRTPYIGNSNAVGEIIYALPKIDMEHTQRFFSIGDDYGAGHAPFTLTVYYEPNGAETSDIRNTALMQRNSVLLFSLIDNLEEINHAFRSTPSDGELDKAAYISRVTHSKNDIAGYLTIIGLSWEAFKNDWSGSAEKIFAVALVSAEDAQTLYEDEEADEEVDEVEKEDLDGFLNGRPIAMLVKDGTATPSGAIVTLKNAADVEYTYGEGYAVQRKNGNGWINVEPAIENWAFSDIGYRLPAMGDAEIMIDWEWIYGKLPAGDYRIIKEAIFVRSPGDYDTFTLFAAFAVVE
jgi:hypothetical protein